MTRNLALIALIYSSAALAAPQTLSHQGRLADASGAALVGDHDLHFALYSAESDTEPFWSESQTVGFENGYFSVLLGTITALDGGALPTDGAYLGLAIDNGAELPTRTALSSVPYALVAQHVQGGIVNASEVLINGQSIVDLNASAITTALASQPPNTDPLKDFICLDGEIPAFTGSAWACLAANAHEHSAEQITSGTLNITHLPIGLTSNHVAPGDHVHPDVATGPHFNAQDAINAVGAANLIAAHQGSPSAHHTKFSNQNAVDAVGANALISTHSANTSAHHTKFSNQDAVNAVGANALISTHSADAAAHHTAFTAADAVSAIEGSTGIKLKAGSVLDATCDSNAAGTLRWTTRLEVCDGLTWDAVGATNGQSQASAGRTCATLLSNHPSYSDGVYWIDPDGDGDTSNAWQAWCDMSRNGGGWTLVMQNNSAVVTSITRPTWNQTINDVLVRGGTFGADLGAFDLLVGLGYWANIGTEARYEVGATAGSPVKQSTFTGFSVDAAANYTLNISGVTNTIGTTAPGLFSYHNGRPWSTVGVDNDIYVTACEALYNHPFWYGDCWSGSIWGSDLGNYQPAAYWDSSGSDYHAWGALWLR